MQDLLHDMIGNDDYLKCAKFIDNQPDPSTNQRINELVAIDAANNEAVAYSELEAAYRVLSNYETINKKAAVDESAELNETEANCLDLREKSLAMNSDQDRN